MIMESDKLYRNLFYIGSGWNFAVAIGLFILIDSLPAMLQIDPPKHTLFIYFNLMSIFMFGCMQFMIARDLYGHRGMLLILMWAKFALVLVFLYALIIDPPQSKLTEFLAPGMIIDLIFGLIFWRFQIFSRQAKKAA